MSQYTTIHAHCPICGGLAQIETEEMPGEINGNAGFILKCSSCGNPFEVHVSGYIETSAARSGAVILETYYDDVHNSREQALAKYGLVSLDVR